MAFGPRWFLGVDVIFDIFFLVVTLVVAVIAFKAHRFFGKGKYLTLGSGFAVLSLSYLLLAITNFMVFAKEGDWEFFWERLLDLSILIGRAYDIRAALFLLGLSILVLLYLRLKDNWANTLILLLVFFGYSLSGDSTSMFYVLASLLLLTIIVKLGEAYLHNPSKHALLVLLGFIGLLTGRVILSVLFVSPLLYVVAHIITLAGFASILASQVMK